VLSAAFAPKAFDSPHAPAHLTAAEATAMLGRFVDLRGRQGVSQFTGWTAPGLFHRAPDSSPNGQVRPVGEAYGHLIWKITVDLTTTDPGRAGACPVGSTAETCPGLRVYHHVVYLMDDKSGQFVMASPY
jgi:hypothetical protein